MEEIEDYRANVCNEIEELFTVEDGKICGYECAIAYTNELQRKKKQEVSKSINREKKEHRANDKVVLKELAQKLVNQYARMRDERERASLLHLWA